MALGAAMGCPNPRYTVTTASLARRAPDTLFTMADPRHVAPACQSPSSDPETGVLLTQADLDALVRELEALRRKHHGEVASAIDIAGIAQLEELVRLACVVEGAIGDGGAGLGSTVRVADDRGRVTEYELIGRRSQDSERHEVTLASPVGRALRGVRQDDVVNVALPNGRERTLRVLDVRHGDLARAA
jgi:hypothetical protein